MITKLIEFWTPDQIALPGMLFTPDQPTQKLAIFLHGNGSASVFYSVPRTLAIAQELTKQGWAFLAFNNRGAHFIKKLKSINEEGEREDRLYGMAYELINECVPDINGALTFGQQNGFSEFILIGHSTGANKIAVYNHFQPKNPVQKYIFLGGGDDTGLYYQELGADQFWYAQEQCRTAMAEGRGREFVSSLLSPTLISYQSFLDTLNPNGDYNVFPFFEYSQKLNLSKQPLFRYFAEIERPIATIYGELDAFCSVSATGAVEILRQFQPTQASNIIAGADHSFTDYEETLAQTIAGCL